MEDHDLSQLWDKHELHPEPFTSSVPVVGPVIVWFRRLWNNVATRWYLAPIIRQQNQFNAELIHALRQQRKRYDAALSAIEERLVELDQRLIELDRDQVETVRTMAEVQYRFVRHARGAEPGLPQVGSEETSRE